MLSGGSMQQTKKNQGFTLIELMVTIAVMAIIATMAAPSFINIINKSQINDDARDFADHIVVIRSDALLKQKEQSLSLNGADAWIPKDKVEWDTNQPVVTTITYNMMGSLKSDNNLCFILRHKKDSNLKAVIITRKNGMVIYDKSLNACPNDLGNE